MKNNKAIEIASFQVSVKCQRNKRNGIEIEIEVEREIIKRIEVQRKLITKMTSF